jgi:4-amino-4-deoxy-L-arabinose transferase-like glycosyltransferase
VNSSDLVSAISHRRRSLAIVGLLAGATVVYGYRLGHAPLEGDEAYSALAAAQPSIAMVVHSVLSLDPGKPVLYQLMLHWFCRCFGLSEAALRAPSVIFAVASVGLIFALGRRWFGFGVGLAAAALWAFNPLAVVLARWARMYSMLVALALGHLVAMANVRRGAGAGTLILAGILGGAMLYTHLGALLIMSAEVLIIIRELRNNGKSAMWPAVAMAFILFSPFVPIAISQSRALLFGDWMDWLGTAHAPRAKMMLFGTLGAALLWWLMAGASAAGVRRESLQRCLIYALVPIAILAGGSVLVRPMFEVRYVSPSIALTAVLAAYLLDLGGTRVRNLGTVTITGMCIALLPLCYTARHDPWAAVAAKIAGAASPGEPIFFEAGFLPGASTIGRDDQGYPQGFFRVPFDYYFHKANPRAVVPASDRAKARKVIEDRVIAAGGAWLVSVKSRPEAIAELPAAPDLRVDFCGSFSPVWLFHIELTDASRSQQAAEKVSAVCSLSLSQGEKIEE